MTNPAFKKQRIPWTRVFSRSKLGRNTFSVKYTQAPHMAAYPSMGEFPRTWVYIIELCRKLGVPCKDTVSGASPGGGVDCDALDFAFLDGGVFSRGGCYIGGIHGAWVYGIKVLRFLCYELNLTQPKAMPGESVIPGHDELRREIEAQLAGSLDELHVRIAANRARYGY